MTRTEKVLKKSVYSQFNHQTRQLDQKYFMELLSLPLKSRITHVQGE